MGVRAETFAWGDAIIIQHPQDAKIRIRGIIIVPKGKRIKSPEPAAIRMSAILTLTKRDHYLSVAELFAHDLCALDERLQLHLGNHAGQRFHAAICGQVHAVGRDHARWMRQEIGDPGVAALRAAKERFDPRGIMNPGKLLPPEG